MYNKNKFLDLKWLKKIKISIVLLSLVLLAGCETAPTQQKRQLTPREVCLEESKKIESICKWTANGSGSRYQQPNTAENIRICQDRKLNYDDRRYARFK